MNLIKISTKKVDLKNPPDGVWTKYAEGAEIQIRKLTRAILKDLRTPFVTMEYDPVARQNVERVDTDGYDEALVMYLIQSFKGFGDEDGHLLEDSLEGRKALMNDLAVRDFVWNYANAAEVIAAEQHRTEIKN